MRPLVALPKAHLHVHLEGAMRPATLRALAEAAGVAMPLPGAAGSRPSAPSARLAAGGLLRTEAHLRRLVDEVVSDAALAGAVWVEPATHLAQHGRHLGSDEEAIEVILDELAQAGSRHNIGTGLMVVADRTLEPAAAIAQARLAVRYAADGVVSFGLHGEERSHPPEPFVEAFAIALAGGLLSTPHAGEGAGPASVVGAVEVLGAHRIQHGVRAVDDPDLVVRLAESDVCLDVCPTANVVGGVVASIAAHPLPDLLAAGVECSVNAGNPLRSGNGLLEEYERCRVEMGLDDHQLAAVARSSLRASGAPDALKARADNAVDAWMAADRDAVA